MCGANNYPHRFASDVSDKEILDHLLYKAKYDKRIRPISESTVVNVSVTLLSLSSPDESSLKYEVEFLMHQDWRDSRLEFDDNGRHTYLNGIHHQQDIWLPDTYFIKHGDFKDPLMPNNIELRIFKDGSIRYTMRRHLILKCEGKLSIFPFDDPKCFFSIESISYEKDSLNYKWREKGGGALRPTPELHTLNAYLVTNITKICDQLNWRGNFSCLKVELTFTRDKSFYFSTVFIPGMLLVTSSFITFWLEWNAVPGRVMLGVTTMLNFFTMSNNFRSNLPVVSNLTAMNVWDGVCMCFIYASLLEFVTVNYLARKKPRSSRFVTAATATATATALSASQTSNTLKREPGTTEVVCSTCPPNSTCTHTVNNSHPTPTEAVKLAAREFPPPIRVAKMIDVVSRVVFPIAYGIFLIFFFVRYKGFP